MQGKNFESKWELIQISLPVLSTTTPLITKLYRGYRSRSIILMWSVKPSELQGNQHYVKRDSHGPFD